MRKNQASPAQAHVARYSYFKAIHVAKRVHLSLFLADVDSQSVWNARKIADQKVPDRFLVLKMPPQQPKLTIHYCTVFSLYGSCPHHPSSSLCSRMYYLFCHLNCRQHSVSHQTLLPLVRVVSSTLSGSESIRPMNGSFHLSSMPSCSMDITLKPGREPMVSSLTNQANQTTSPMLPFAFLSFLKLSPKYFRGSLPSVSPRLPSPLASCTLISMAP